MPESELFPIVAASGWTGVAILCSISAYRAIPAFVERYRVRTQQLTEKNARQAQSIAKKVNGALHGMSLHDIERGLANSKWFLANVIAPPVDALRRALDEHIQEDREMHERVRATEVRLAELKDDVQEIKQDLRKAAAVVTTEAIAIRKEQAEGERRIIDAVNVLFERRKELR